MWYTIDEALEPIDNSLELTLLEKADLSLMMSVSTSMFIIDSKQAICKSCIASVDVENNVFTNSLISTTIQDGSKRKRNNNHTFYLNLK